MRTRILVCLYLAVAVLPIAAMALALPDQDIYGALAPTPRPELAVDAVRSEDYQKAFTAWFDSHLGWKGGSIKTDNAILLHAFHDTKPGLGLVLGNRRVLFAMDDINYYNTGVDQLPSPARLDALAGRIAVLQQTLRAQHRALVPVIVPSKTSVYRDAVPRAWTRALGEPRPTDVGAYRAMKHALEAHGVTYVDAREILTAPGVQRAQVWGPQARHWSTYGACLAMREVVRAFGALTGNDPLPYDCTPHRVLRPPGDDDFDLWNLLNAWRPPPPRQLQTEAAHPPPSDGATRPTLVFVGTSFCGMIMRDAFDSGQFGRVHMDYYHRALVQWPRGSHVDIDPSSPEGRAVLLDRDLYMLDLFETYLVGTESYADQFLTEIGEEIERRAGRAAP